MTILAEFRSNFTDALPKGESCPQCHNNQIRKVLFSSDVQAQSGRYGCYECSHCETEIKEIYDPILLMQLGMRSRAVQSLIVKFQKKLTSKETQFLIDYGCKFNPTVEEKIAVNKLIHDVIFDGLNLFDIETKIPVNDC